METAQPDYLLEECKQYLCWLQFEKIEGSETLTPDTLIESLSEGIILLKTMDLIYKNQVDWTKVNRPAEGLFKKIDNMSYFAQLCKERGVPNEGIHAKVLAEGDADSMLSILWLLMRQSFIVLRGAQNEEEIRLMAQQFATQPSDMIAYDAMEIEALSIKLYYGIEGEIFAAFDDEDDIDCPKLPETFDLLTTQPSDGVSSLRVHMTQLTNIVEMRECVKSQRKAKIVTEEHSDSPAAVDVGVLCLVSKPIPQETIKSSTIQTCYELPDLTPSKESLHIPHRPQSNHFFSKSHRISHTQHPTYMDDISDTVKKHILCRSSSIPVDHSPDVNAMPSCRVDVHAKDGQVESRRYAAKSIIVDDLPTVNNRINSTRMVDRDADTASKSNTHTLSFNQADKLIASSTSKNPINTTMSYQTSSNTITHGTAIDDMPHTGILTNNLESGHNLNNLMVSEVYEEFERSNSMHMFNGYATIMRSVSGMIREKGIQKKSCLDNFKVGDHKCTTSYYLRLTKGFNRYSLPAALKIHDRFVGYHYKELFDHGLDKSECYDPRTDEDKQAKLICIILKTASRIGLSDIIKPSFDKSLSQKELTTLRSQLAAPKTPQTLAQRLLQKRIQHCIDLQTPITSNTQYHTLTLIRTRDKDYLDLAAFNSLPAADKSSFYRFSIMVRMSASLSTTHIGRRLSRYVSDRLVDPRCDDVEYYALLHGVCLDAQQRDSCVSN